MFILHFHKVIAELLLLHWLGWRGTNFFLKLSSLTCCWKNLNARTSIILRIQVYENRGIRSPENLWSLRLFVWYFELSIIFVVLFVKEENCLGCRVVNSSFESSLYREFVTSWMFFFSEMQSLRNIYFCCFEILLYLVPFTLFLPILTNCKIMIIINNFYYFHSYLIPSTEKTRISLVLMLSKSP